MANQSPDPAAQILGVNRSQTVAATGVNTGVPGSPSQGGDPMRGQGGYRAGSAPGVGPASGQEPAGAVGNTSNVSPGSPSGDGAPGVVAAGLSGPNTFPNVGGINTYGVGAGGRPNTTDDPAGGQNGATPANAWELVSRTS
jgi:hypothetical protein